MYNSNQFTSDLVNSYAWDTAIVFIQEFSGDSDYSKQKAFTSFGKTGETTDGINKDIRCNIYDMATNGSEFITETYARYIGEIGDVWVGGYYLYSQDYGLASTRQAGWVNSGSSTCTARPLIYI